MGPMTSQLDVAAAKTEVGGLEAHRGIAACLADFDDDLNGVASMEAAIGFGYSGVSEYRVFRERNRVLLGAD
jgi:hypothetical protein